MIGLFQAENITGCFALARALGVETKAIIKAVAEFKGLKRRMEKRFEGAVTVVDDIAHSPEKARSALSTLRSIYKGKIIAVFEPNIGGRETGAAGKYDGAFKDADIVIIPRLTKLKMSGDPAEAPMEGDALAKVIGKSHPETRYLDDDRELVKEVLQEAKKEDVIVFLGSHGFRGMIEEVVTSLRLRSQS
jgi:UDP-N-acetylmuramate-alanine ligase